MIITITIKIKLQTKKNYNASNYYERNNINNRDKDNWDYNDEEDKKNKNCRKSCEHKNVENNSYENKKQLMLQIEDNENVINSDDVSNKK